MKKIAQWVKDNPNFFLNILMGIAAALAIYSLVSVATSGKTKKISVDAAASVEIKSKQLTIEQGFSALFRSFTADQICYNEDQNAFFLHFDESLKDWHGWWILKDIDLKYIAKNDTWYVEDNLNVETKIYPSVKGLRCGLSTEYIE